MLSPSLIDVDAHVGMKAQGTLKFSNDTLYGDDGDAFYCGTLGIGWMTVLHVVRQRALEVHIGGQLAGRFIVAQSLFRGHICFSVVKRNCIFWSNPWNGSSQRNIGFPFLHGIDTHKWGRGRSRSWYRFQWTYLVLLKAQFILFFPKVPLKTSKNRLYQAAVQKSSKSRWKLLEVYGCRIYARK